MERVHGRTARRDQRDVRRAADGIPADDPEARLPFRAEPRPVALEVHHDPVPERGQRLFVEALAGGVVRDVEGDVVDHLEILSAVVSPT